MIGLCGSLNAKLRGRRNAAPIGTPAGAPTAKPWRQRFEASPERSKVSASASPQPGRRELLSVDNTPRVALAVVGPQGID
jgi:hypothetical protein